MNQWMIGLLLGGILVFAIFFGAQLTEACVLVPYWKRLEAAEFLAWYRQHGDLLGRFYTPLTLLALGLTVAIAVLFWRQAPSTPTATVAVLIGGSIGILATYFLYFKGANADFATGNIALEKVGDRLQTWAYWHWARLVLEAVVLWQLGRLWWVQA